MKSLRSYSRVAVVAFFTLSLLLSLTCSLFAQQPASKIKDTVQPKKHTPQPKIEQKIDAQQARAMKRAEMLGKLVIGNFVVSSPLPQCNFEWSADIGNPNDADLDFVAEVSKYNAYNSKWELIATQSVQLAKHELKSFRGQSKFKDSNTKLKLTLKDGQRVFKEQEVPFPALPVPNVEITGIDITSDRYMVHVKNKGAVPQCDLTVQCHSMTEQNGPTQPAGGQSIDIPSYSTISEVFPHRGMAGVKFIKCDVYSIYRQRNENIIYATKTVPVNQ